MSAHFSATCEFSYYREATIQSEITARVEDIYFQSGARVGAGTSLLKLNSDEYERQEQAAKAVLDSARADAVSARIEWRRAADQASRSDRLRTMQLISQTDFLQLHADAEKAQAQLVAEQARSREASANLEAARSVLGKTTIRAPFAGTVVAVDAEVGETAVPSSTSIEGSTLLRLADISKLRVKIHLTGRQLVSVRRGEKVSIQVPGIDGLAMDGTVILVPYVNKTAAATGESFFEVVALVESPPPAVRPGMECRAQMAPNVLMASRSIPNEAVYYESSDGEGGDLHAYALVQAATDRKARKVPISLGASDSQRTQVLSGVANGDRVLVGVDDPAQVAGTGHP